MQYGAARIAPARRRHAAAAADRATVSGADFAALLPDVARRLLGDPPRATDAEWRYGSHGSLSVHPTRGTWHDFEADAGGGALALIEHVNGCDKAGALQWLVAARLIAPPAGPGRTPAARRRPGGASTPPAPPAPALALPTAPKPAPTAAVAAAILAAAVPADDTPARAYLAAARHRPRLARRGALVAARRLGAPADVART